jgi:hypothetical protein
MNQIVKDCRAARQLTMTARFSLARMMTVSANSTLDRIQKIPETVKKVSHRLTDERQ